MSSNPAQLLPTTSGWRVFAALGTGAALWFSASLCAPLAAQDEPVETQADETDEAEPVTPPPRRRERIDLTITVPKNESDALLEQDCEEEADAARIANEIVVCRQLGEGTDGSWNREEWLSDYAARTQGGSTPDVAGGGIFQGPATFGGLCLIPPCPPEAALMIDIEALPEAPPGSDADRIARGLPPLGEDEGPSPEEIAKRRRALGLEAPESLGQ